MCLLKLPNFSTTIMVIYAPTPIFNIFRPLHNLGRVSKSSAAIPGCADKSEFQNLNTQVHRLDSHKGSWFWVQIQAPRAARIRVFLQPAYREGSQHSSVVSAYSSHGAPTDGEPTTDTNISPFSSYSKTFMASLCKLPMGSSTQHCPSTSQLLPVPHISSKLFLLTANSN